MAKAFRSPFTIDTGQLSKLSKALKAASPEIAKDLAVELRTAGDLVAAEARKLSSWSTRIPGSITVTGGVASVRISAGGPKAPHAAPYENRGNEGAFRHPVYGHDDRWVSEGARPFMVPALAAKDEELAAGINRAIDKTIERFVKG